MTTLVVAVGVGVSADTAPQSVPMASASGNASSDVPDPDRTLLAGRTSETISRDAERTALTRQRLREAAEKAAVARSKQRREARRQQRATITRMWTTAPLNVWSRPGEDSRLLDITGEGVRVRATGEVSHAWAQIARGKRFAWVRGAYLVAREPVEETSGPGDGGGSGGSSGSTESLSGAACPDGSSVESGLTANAVAVYRATCAAFPAVSVWGGVRPGDDGYHGSGQAVDIMVYEDAALGQAIAGYVQANAAPLGVSEVIWEQQIWTVERASEGWRPMDDLGSATANHYDHVHVSVY